jgi:hypothetical protein
VFPASLIWLIFLACGWSVAKGVLLRCSCSAPESLRAVIPHCSFIKISVAKVTGPILRIAVSTFCRCHADVQANPPNRHYDPGNVVFLLFFPGLFKMES